MPKRGRVADSKAADSKEEASIQLSADELAQLKGLLKQAEELVNDINAPLFNIFLIALMRYIVSPIVFGSGKVLAIKKDVDSNGVLWNRILMGLVGLALIYGFNKSRSIAKKVNEFFPNGFLHSQRKPNSNIAAIKKLLQGEDVEKDVQQLLENLKQYMQNDLQPQKNRIGKWSLAILALSNFFRSVMGESFILTRLLFFINERILSFSGVVFLAKEIYRKIKEFLKNIGHKRRVQTQTSQLEALSLGNKWELFDDGQEDLARFVLKFPSPETEVLFKNGDEKETKTLAKNFMPQLTYTLKKYGFNVLSHSKSQVVVETGHSIGEKRTRQFKAELREHLKRALEVRNNRVEKQAQLDRLMQAIKGDSSWFVLSQNDNQGYPDLHFVIPEPSIASKMKIDFMHHLSVLFGHNALSEENGSVIVRGCKLATGAELENAIQDLRKKHLESYPVISEAPAQQSSSSSRDEKIALKPKPDRKRNSSSPLDTKDIKKETAPSLVTIISQLKAKRPANEKLYALNVPWCKEGLYFASVNEEKVRDQLGAANFSQFQGYLDRGDKVQGNFCSGVGIFSTKQSYTNLDNKKREAIFKIKNKRNMRLYGSLVDQVQVDGQTRKIVTFDGVVLRAH